MRIDVAPELQCFLAPSRRGSPLDVAWDGQAGWGHVVQSVGVPLTEVGVLRVGPTQVSWADRPRPDDIVTVDGRPRPQPLPSTEPRFLLDVHLGSLARRLRLLGLDAAYRNDATDADLVAEALGQARLLLTRDRGLLRRRALWENGPRAAYVRGDLPDDQLADVLSRFSPPLAPWTRCPRCNGTLESVAKSDVLPLLRPGTRRSYDAFARCAGCGRPYWSGAHAPDLAAIVARSRAIVHGRSSP